MREIDSKEVKKKLSRLVDEAAQGDSFIVTVDGKPKVKEVSVLGKSNLPNAAIPSATP